MDVVWQRKQKNEITDFPKFRKQAFVRSEICQFPMNSSASEGDAVPWAFPGSEGATQSNEVNAAHTKRPGDCWALKLPAITELNCPIQEWE